MKLEKLIKDNSIKKIIIFNLICLTGLTLALNKLDVEKNLILYLSNLVLSNGFYMRFRHNWLMQNKRSVIISLIKQLKETIVNPNHTRLTVSLLLTIVSFVVYDNYLDVWKLSGKNILPELNSLHYGLTLPIGGLIYTMYNIRKSFNKVKCMQDKADKTINGLKIIEETKKVVLVTSTIPLDISYKSKLESIINSSISHIRRDKSVLNKYHIELGKNDYRKLEAGTIARLEQILINMKDKPNFINSTETDNEIVYKFTTILPIKRIMRLKDDINHKMGIGLNKGNIEVSNGYILYKISKDVTRTYLLDEVISDITVKKDLEFILGVNMNNGNVVTDTLTNLKHLLIAGKTGSGKSCTFKCIIESLMYFHTNIVWYMLDFADSALVRYEDFYNVNYVESELQHIQSAIDELLKEYDKRKKAFRQLKVENIQEYNKVNNEQLPYICFAIDEANAFKSEMDKKDFEPIEKQIKTLLQRGRKYGMFCLMAVQQTNDNDFVKSWKTQFTRIAHLLEDTIDCCNITTKKEYQQMIPTLQTGEFFVLSETDNYKLKGYLTNNEHNELYETLKKGYVLNDKSNKKVNLEKTKLTEDKEQNSCPEKTTVAR